ncbi:ATP-binding protein [Asticcacaulis sp. EMRT-3]|uniref:sensor histidine kinase n=1 Tax=Asticcacaulis sp. EMRT-3 TaxID=3040349 RepID=UPI0024AEAAA6|nr:ATP-binding protein [Asticcacaulis sp. EMRT-3]MDI7774568.1 ATP-binding protein [Asticcacaulis sp. EMRT-3]
MTTMQVTGDAEAEFRDFVYIVSHDLAGPVRSMVAFSQLLKEQLGLSLTDDDQLHLDLIVESGEKLGDMIQGLLAFSRLNTVQRVSTVCDLEIVMARCYMEAQPRLDATKGQLNYPRMPELTADPSRMFTLFYAIIDNALKFRSDHVAPDIRIQIEERPDAWLFHISDNGIGIDPMFYDDVFRPLRKLHTDEAYPGVGMGLTLARKIVLQHGGAIWLEPSGRLSGLTVSFSLTKKPKT